MPSVPFLVQGRKVEMQLKLTFLGAAQNITGSRYLLDTGSTRIMVDCGLFQEREFRSRNWEPFTIPPRSIDAMLLTHAHLDHCGLLPKLVREGFQGSIYCTRATSEIAKIMLLDAGKLQQEDAEFKRKRHQSEGRRGPYPEIPLYTVADAEASFSFFHVRSDMRNQLELVMDSKLVSTMPDMY